MIGIRADANNIIAMGHIMRCLSIAKQIQRYGEDVIFISSDASVQERIVSEGFDFLCLHNDYLQKDLELDTLQNIIREKGIATLLLDSYQVTESYMKCLDEMVRLIYIDDLNAFCYPVAGIVNYTAHANMDLYKDWGYGKDVEFCLGSDYIPLRKEFAENRIMIREQIEGIFITTGGTDPYDVILDLLKVMNTERYAKVKKYVVVGKFYNKLEALKRLEDDMLIVYQNINNIYDIMKKCDIAISAGGTTVSELCAMGIPTIAFTMADNQLGGIQAYKEDGIIFYAGDVRDDKELVIATMEGQIRKLMYESDARQKLSQRALERIDGMGAERIARLILQR